MKSLEYLLKRLSRLSETLTDLKERVREAVAGELSRVVAQTVQDVVHAWIRGRCQPTDHEPPPEDRGWPDHDPWQDDDDDHVPADPVPRELDPIHEVVPTEPGGPQRWERAFTMGAGILRWWLAGRWKPIVGLGVAGLVGTAVGCGGPAVETGCRIALTAAELIAFGSSSMR